MIAATEALAEYIPLAQACTVLDFPRSSLYRSRQARPIREKPPRPAPPRALSPVEKETVRNVLNSERFLVLMFFVVNNLPQPRRWK
jgi:hypothetical protein